MPLDVGEKMFVFSVNHPFKKQNKTITASKDKNKSQNTFLHTELPVSAETERQNVDI